MSPYRAPVGSPLEEEKSGSAWYARCMIACESKMTSRETAPFLFSVLLFAVIGNGARIFVEGLKRDADRTPRYRIPYILGPFEKYEIPRVLHELMPPEHLKLVRTLQAI